MNDPHKPLRNGPARKIYEALCSEMKKRKITEHWQESERAVVYATACQVAKEYGLREPTMEYVKKSESLAIGHSDYASKWARGLINYLTK